MIKIDNPCSEDWDKMHPKKTGRFCNHCQEHIRDFSTLSDNELARLIAGKEKVLCGRFSNDQLERFIPMPSKEKRFSYLTKVAASLLLFVTPKAHAHSTHNNTDKFSGIKNNISKKTRTLLIEKPIEIKGIVIDANTNQPIPNAIIVISSPTNLLLEKTGYKTDEEGNYSIIINDSTEKRDITFIIACKDYEEATVKIKPEDFNTQINVFLSPITNNGDIVLTSTPVQKYSALVGEVLIIKPKKKHFNFWNLFRSKKNRK